MNYKINLILNNIRSAENVGSIFRTADAVDVERIYLVGITPDPIDRFGRPNPKIEKSALGAEKNIAWEHSDDIVLLIEKLKKEGFEIVALEQDENSIDFRKYNPKEKVALILGNEVGGIDKKVLSLSDKIIEIPMLGEKESLNVSVAAGIALYSFLRD